MRSKVSERTVVNLELETNEIRNLFKGSACFLDLVMREYNEYGSENGVAHQCQIVVKFTKEALSELQFIAAYWNAKEKNIGVPV
jgi:hypothetical protein